ncbi:hypothetical protein [Staphylococcus phage vB_StaM_PB50]|nr:hypothetical protein [Staphylococcus phage vB_StaM_PB50]
MNESLYVSDILEYSFIDKKSLSRKELFDISFDQFFKHPGCTGYDVKNVRLWINSMDGLILRFGYDMNNLFYVNEFDLFVDKNDGQYEFSFVLDIPAFSKKEVHCEIGPFVSREGEIEFYFNDTEIYTEGKTLLDRAKEYLTRDIFNKNGSAFNVFSLNNEDNIHDYKISKEDIKEIYNLNIIDELFKEVTDEKEIKNYLVKKGFE